MRNRTLPGKANAMIVRFIRAPFGALGRRLHPPALKSAFFIHSMVISDFLEQTVFNFKCSDRFLSPFLQRHGPNTRKARAARKPEINDRECATFMIALPEDAKKCRESNIVSFDESN
jgi:hypothetical protein